MEVTDLERTATVLELILEFRIVQMTAELCKRLEAISQELESLRRNVPPDVTHL